MTSMTIMNGTTQDQGCIIADRGGIVENRHYVHAAVVDSKGQLLYSVGNPDRMTLLRSAAKPAQALAILETGAGLYFGFDEADLALMCASHNAEERHIKRARSMLYNIHAEEDDLRCGGHPSISPLVAQEWLRADFTPTAVYNNCSGKHAGMLAGTKVIGAEMDGYHVLEHPMQQRVKRVVEELCGANEGDVKWAVDGCNLPAPAMSLHHGAQIYANLAEASDVYDDNPPASLERKQSLARIFRAMSRHSYLVAGEGRFCTELMESFQGTLVGKVGADGYYGVAIRASEQTRLLGGEGAIGVAVKIEDGDREIVYSAVVEILEQLQIGTADMRRGLDDFHHPKRSNTAGVEIGHVSHAFRLHASGTQNPKPG